jgi:hypothetical protein
MLSKIMDMENYHQDPHRILIKVEFPKEFQRLKFIIPQHNIRELKCQLKEARNGKRNSDKERAILVKIREFTTNLLTNTYKQREDIDPYLIKFRTNKNLEGIFEIIAKSVPLKVFKLTLGLKTLMKDFQKLEEHNHLKWKRK